MPSRNAPKRNHNAKRTIEFIGVDGEGVNRPDGKHEYVLLSCGNRSLYFPDGRKLTCYDILPFLWQCFTSNPTAAYVGFYLGYDFTHWLRDLPENRARMLLTSEGISLRKRRKSGGNATPFPVNHRQWCFDTLGMKRFRFWECLNHTTEHGHKCTSDLRMYICDTGPFFQTSFLNAVDPVKWPDGPILSDDEYKRIAKGKAERGNETVPYGTPIDPEMIEYNILENEILSRLMHKYNDGLCAIGINLKRDQWFGPGQAAQTWMNKIGAPKREQFEKSTSISIRNACRSSYYGGWFEIFGHGHIPGISFSYDVNSAYPDIQSRLPCAIHGKWRIGNASKNEIAFSDHAEYTIVYGTARGDNYYIGAAPHRLKTGNILRPNVTRGWYWWHEILAARNAGLIDEIQIEQIVSYEPCNCNPPFFAERKLYEDRLRVGKNTMGGKARRLVYNSTYGKTAQSIGVAKFANPFYASLITSLCRTYILNAIATHPIGAKDVLMVATDGITFRHRHPNLYISPTVLGQWTETKHENLTLFMPGIYWDDSVRLKLREGTHPTLKSRGIPGRALANQIETIDEQFNSPFTGRGFPRIPVPLNFGITTPKQALARGKWNTCGDVTLDGERIIDSDPYMKRNSNATYMEDGIIRTPCYIQAPTIESTPYNKTFGDEELKELALALSQDGDLEMLLAQALKGD